MTIRIALAGIFFMAIGAAQPRAEDQQCRSGCIKAYNECKSECGASTATLPWHPVGRERLTKINECVRSQCQQPLSACEGKCH
jgi:hypothetical protein